MGYEDPPPSGTTGPIAYPATGDIAPNLMSDTGAEPRQSHESPRPSTGTTAAISGTRSNHSSSGDDHGHGLEGEGLRFPPALRTMTSTGKPYSSFSNGMKWVIVTLAGIAAVFSPIRYVLFLVALTNQVIAPRELELMSVPISSYQPSRPLPGSSIEVKNKSH